ncbi:MAG: ATP-binding protein [Fimbriimonadaceae bacterium]|nr:ATP-binding protein [Fimbriimonadaceae bacterium]
MPVDRFAFKDGVQNWELRSAELGELNLLIGVSGAGKTRVLDALRTMRRIALGERLPPKITWEMEIHSGAKRFRWTGKTGAPSQRPEAEALMAAESLSYNGDVIVERSRSRFTLSGRDYPKFTRAFSAVALFDEVERIAPVANVMRRMLFSEVDRHRDATISYSRMASDIQTLQEASRTPEAIRSLVDIPILVRAYLLQQNCVEDFAKIKSDYCSIFPTVRNLEIGPLSQYVPDWRSRYGLRDEPLVTACKELGVRGWVTWPIMSAGMQRSLVHLLEDALAPDDTIILIDEFENGLGVNCLDTITANVMARRGRVQYILTSHHPYIINNIPIECWRLVQRRGAVVDVRPAAALPALQGVSRHQQFMRLMNTPEYRHGVQ